MFFRYACQRPLLHCWRSSHAMPAPTRGSFGLTFAAFERGERETLAERAVEARVLHAEQPLVASRGAGGREQAVHEVVLLRSAAEVPGILRVGDRRHHERGERAGCVVPAGLQRGPDLVPEPDDCLLRRRLVDAGCTHGDNGVRGVDRVDVAEVPHVAAVGPDLIGEPLRPAPRAQDVGRRRGAGRDGGSHERDARRQCSADHECAQSSTRPEVESHREFLSRIGRRGVTRADRSERTPPAQLRKGPRSGGNARTPPRMPRRCVGVRPLRVFRLVRSTPRARANLRLRVSAGFRPASPT